MKKYIFILLAVLGVLFSQAQSVGNAVAFVQDTTTDAETEYLVPATPVAIGLNYTVGIGIVPINISGTATVVASLEFSNNNSTWYSYGTTTTINTAGTVGKWSWILNDMPFKYVRVKCVSTGTGVTRLNGEIILKKR